MHVIGRFSAFIETQSCLIFFLHENSTGRFADVKASLRFLELFCLPFCFWNTAELDLLIFYLDIWHLYSSLWFLCQFSFVYYSGLIGKLLLNLASLLNTLTLEGQNWASALYRSRGVWSPGVCPRPVCSVSHGGTRGVPRLSVGRSLLSSTHLQAPAIQPPEASV